MAYEQRRLGRQKVRYNSDNDDNSLIYQLVLDGEKITPTSATIAIYRPGAATAILAATAMTKSGTLLSYKADTTTVANFPIATGFRADIVVTYNSLTYDRHLMFDVVKYLLVLGISYDQVEAFDDGVRGATHAGDEDLSPLIQSCRDVIQLRIEQKVLEDDRLLENMILDESQMSIPALHYILHRFWFEKGNEYKSEYYKAEFDNLMRAALASIKYDTDQDGEEDATIGGIQVIRLVS